MSDLASLSISQPYSVSSPSAALRRELHLFSDASTKAIAAVAYLRVTDAAGNKCWVCNGESQTDSLSRTHSAKARALCCSCEAVELADLISTELDLSLDAVTYYSDSKVVLGYVHNETRCFYVYVSNRVLCIRRSSHPDQWCYVSTDENPADYATRSVAVSQLKDTSWLSGPRFLSIPGTINSENSNALVDPSSDPDIRPLVSTLATTTTSKQLGSQRLTKFSSWKSLTRTIDCLIHIARLFNTTVKNSSCKGWHYCKPDSTVEESRQASATIIQTVQVEVYGQEFKCCQRRKKVPKSSPLYNLDPFIDAQGFLRVGGRLCRSNLDHDEKTPSFDYSWQASCCDLTHQATS